MNPRSDYQTEPNGTPDGESGVPNRSRLALWLLLGAMLLLTLVPLGSGPIADSEVRMLVDRRVADTILNVALFAPLGALLAARGRSLLLATLVAAALSGLIEAGQLFTAGRDPTLRDLAANVLGSAVGHRCFTWLRARAGRLGLRRLALPVAGVAAAALLAGTFLLPVSPPSARLSVHATPGEPLPEREDWTVREARVAGTSLAAGRLDSVAGRRLRAFLSGRGAPLAVEGTTGAPLSSARPLLVMVDRDHRYRLGLEVRGDALLVRWPRAADAWLLDNPRQRFEGVFDPGAPPGTPFRLSVERTATGACASVDGRRRCRPDASVARAWSLLLAPRSWPAIVLRTVDASFLLLLFLGVGLTLHASPASLGGAAAVAAACLLSPLATSVPPAPAAALGAAAAGLLAGCLLGRRLRGGEPEEATADR